MSHYVLWRVTFALYLAVHFVQLFSWAREMFSNRGVLPDATASPLLFLFPNVLAVWDSPAFVQGMLGAAVALCGLLAVGQWDRAAAVGLWYVLACLFGRNPLISNPSLPYVGWLLLAHAVMPSSRLGRDWRMPPGIYFAAWVVMAIGYSYSGATKLVSPSWLDGSALSRILENPLSRPNAVRDLLASLPAVVLQVATWGALLLELLFAPLAISTYLRPLVWGAMLAMHLALLTLIDFADLSFGMIILHLFTFDPAWLGEKA